MAQQDRASSNAHRLGQVTLDPSGPIVAGCIGTWTLQLTVGSYGIDEGGTIKVARRFASDWQTPQFDRPDEPAYTTVKTDGEARLAVRYDRKGHVRPWMKCLVIDVYDGSLAEGDTVTVVLGDRSQGSPGIRAQSFVETVHEIRVLVDPTNACLVRRLETSPILSIIPDEPVALVCVVPTAVMVDQAVRIALRSEDRWGNPTPAPQGTELQWDGEPQADLQGHSLTVRGAGHGRVIARTGAMTGAMTASSNPLTAYTEAQPYQRYWGDLHAQTGATVGTGTEEEYFTFARDQAFLDFASHQGNDFQMDDEDWSRLNKVVGEFHDDGRFVVFPGFEWSGNSPAGGDRNVFYLEEGMPIMRSSHWQSAEVEETELTPAHPADQLFAKIREHLDLDKVLVAAHVGGRYADIRRYFDEEIGPLVELVSCWGVFEWLLWDAFDMGYQVGVMCNSDGHKGRPGSEGPGAGDFGIKGGLTCVLAEAQTREAIFKALKARRCYGTTGPRMDLDFRVDGELMGGNLDATGPVEVTASVLAESAVEALELYAGRERIAVTRPAAFAECEKSRRVRVKWGGARIRGRARRVIWDGAIEVEGARIERATTFAFDSPAEGIQDQSSSAVRFRSRTTGDVDGIDLYLDQANTGLLRLRTEIGELVADLSDLDTEGVKADYGGMGIHAEIRRYPVEPHDRALTLRAQFKPVGETPTPLFVKAIQCDGHAAWASPVYVEKARS